MNRIFNIFVLSLCVSQFALSDESTSSKKWPDDMCIKAVSQYIADRPIVATEGEYIYLLAFLQDLIAACEYNIENYFNQTSSMQFISSYIGDQIIIVKVERTILVWDDENKVYKILANISVFDEFFKVYFAMKDFNSLIDLWHKKTNILLKERYEISKEMSALNDYLIYRSNGAINFDIVFE
jgi:hypothetical protein